MMNWPGDEGLFEVVTTRFFLKKKHHYSTFLPNVSAIQPSKKSLSSVVVAKAGECAKKHHYSTFLLDVSAIQPSKISLIRNGSRVSFNIL